MKTVPQDSSVTSTEEPDEIIVEPKPKIAEKPTVIHNIPPEQANLFKSFPWMAEFIKLCQTEAGIPNIRSLEKLMNTYHKYVEQSVNECYSRPNRAAKLKRSMSDMLMFFHMTYSEFKPPFEHSSYLAKMSDLMAMYLDMEIKASRTGTESLPKIASKLTSSLHVYFGRSHDHILDTILKTKIINKNSWELCDLIFRRVLRDSPGSSVYILSYIRYILVFKMWKGIMKWREDRKKITKLAALKLKPPAGFREKLLSGGILRDILPRIPKARTDITTFLMQAKYQVKDKVQVFLRAAADPKLHCALDCQNFVTAIENPPNPDGKEDNESNVFMSDIWSNMSIEDSLRLSNITSRSNSKKSRKLKHGSSRSASKMELLKKKRKKIFSLPEEIGEDDKEEDNSCEIIEDIPVTAIKSEVEEVIRKEQVNQVDSVCEGDTMEVAAEVELPASPSEVADMPIKVEPQPSQSKEVGTYSSAWGIPNYTPYYNNVSFDYVVDSKSAEFSPAKTPDNTDHTAVFEVLDKDVILTEESQNVENCSGIEIETNATPVTVTTHCEEQVIDDSKSIDALRAQGILYEKSVPSKDVNGSSEYSFQEKGIGVLHDFTVKNDSKIYEFQIKVYSYANKLTARTWIGLLSPLFSEQSRLKFYRCWCNGCKANLCVIRRNWKAVMACIMINNEKLDENGRNAEDYCDDSIIEDLKAVAEGEKGDVMCWESEIDELLKKIEEIIKEDNEHSSLPLKKRKAFSYSTYVKDEKTEMSYPGTPMISIAALELPKEKCTVTAMNLHHSAVNNSGQLNYVPNYATHANYSPVTAVTEAKYDSVIVQSDTKGLVAEQNLVPGAFTTTFIPENQDQQRIKFKTPAQLKEFQHLSAAQDLINFAHTSRTYYNQSQEPQEPKKEKEREKRQTRQKTKSSSRKRKRAI